ncbi:unnamed protein product [Closterium sp. Yama58-4]|nr:unnamed protein product [Closterium sp. Yama58-4]
MAKASTDPFDKMLQRSIQELRDLQPTLLDAATYAEEAYLVTDQKDIELHNVRDYAVSMLVSVVDRIGAAADRFTDAVSLQAKEMAAADVRVASAAERVRACWEYSGRNALNRQQQPRATSRMPKSYLLPAEAAPATLTPALAAAAPPASVPPASAAAAAACMERECFQYGSGYSSSPTRDPRGSSHTAFSSSSLLSSMPLAPPSESLLDSLASSSLVPRSATAGVPSVRASLDCLAGLPPSSSSISSSSSFPSSSFPSSSFPSSSSAIPFSSSTLSNPSSTTPHSADKILSRKQSHSHNLSHSPNLSHSHNLPHFSNLSRSHNLSQSHSLMHSLSHSLSQHMGHRSSHARHSKEPTTPKAHFPLVASSLHTGGALGGDDVEGSDRRSTTPHRRGRQLLKNIFSRGVGGGAGGGSGAGGAAGAAGAGAGAGGASGAWVRCDDAGAGAVGDGSGGYMSTQRAHDRGFSGHL